jgi:outer membrane protein
MDANALTYGFVVEWPIFDSGFTKGRVKEAQSGVDIASQVAEQVRLSVISDVTRAYLNLKTAEQRVTTADAQVANAAEALRLTEGRYKAGLGEFLDVLDAQTSLLTARTNRVNAQFAVDRARVALVHAVGATRVAEIAAGK